MKVLAIDPGTDKCGLAVLCSDNGILHREITTPNEVAARTSDLVYKYQCDKILLGSGTGSAPVQQALTEKSLDTKLEMVDEQFTTLKARERFFQDHPPKGLWRLIPLSLQHPREPFDDYVAIILAERWLESGCKS